MLLMGGGGSISDALNLEHLEGGKINNWDLLLNFLALFWLYHMYALIF